MKYRVLLLVAFFAGCFSCSVNNVEVKDPLTAASPQPTMPIVEVVLTEQESHYVDAGNTMALQLFAILAAQEENMILSPLSIQYALGMTANGASGETLGELMKAMGYEEVGIAELNTYCKKLLNQLPAVDLNVKIKLADALLVNEQYPLLPAFRKTVQDTYYAAVENMSFRDAEQVAARINDWSSRNTKGLIEKMLEPHDIDPAAIAYLMNALYFNAKWAGYDFMFDSNLTREEDFFPGGCTVEKVPTMHTIRQFNYAAMDGFQVLEVPFAGGRYAMFILLPEGEYVGDPEETASGKYTFSHLLQDLPKLDWKAMMQKLKPRSVSLSLPKFETSSSFLLNDVLGKLGVKRAFGGAAQFDRMFQDPHVQACISKVIQKARIAVSEWGTEAAVVSIVEMKETATLPGEDPVKFCCDHPFAYFIAEKTSGVILFEGAYRHGGVYPVEWK